MNQIFTQIDTVLLIEIGIAFSLKFLDNALGTAKTIFISKEKYTMGAIFNALSSFFYLIAIVRVANNNNILSIIAMCIATFVGTLLPGILFKKTEREKLWIFDITSTSLENGKNFADVLRKSNVPVKTSVTYDKYMNKTLSCTAYCSTKEESKIVQELIPEDFKWNVFVPISESN